MSQTIAEVIYEEGRLKGQQEGLLKGKQEGKQEGRQEGKQEGRQEGRQEGEQEGELKALRRTLRQLLEQRFGGVSADLAQRIDKASDLHRLNAAILQVAKLTTPDELSL